MDPYFEFDPLRQNHVLHAPARSNRPFQENVDCPFCLGSIEVPDPVSPETMKFLPNRFPSMIYDKNQGICEVILYTSDHSKPLLKYSSDEIQFILLGFQQKQKDIIAKFPEIRYVFFFENSGREMGISLDHPHGQLYCFPIVPPIIEQEYNSFSGLCIFCGFGQHQDMRKKYEVLHENESFRLLFPKYSRWPVEILIASRDHLGSITDFNKNQILDLSEIMQKGFRVFTSLYPSIPPYILAFHQSPIYSKSSDEFHFHIELFSLKKLSGKMKYLAGVELATGIYINSESPMQVLERIKQFLK